jgi:hypothetical protein
MNVLAKRTTRTDEVLEGKFIRRVLEETAKEIDETQRKAMQGFNSDFWNNRAFVITSNQLTLTHDKRIRFVDMKNRLRKDGSKTRKKSYVVHNRIIMGKYNYLVRELAYGYTDAVKAELGSLED